MSDQDRMTVRVGTDVYTIPTFLYEAELWATLGLDWEIVNSWEVGE